MHLAAEPWLENKLEAGEELRWWGLSGRRLYRISPLFFSLFSLFGLYMASAGGWFLYQGLTQGADAVFIAFFLAFVSGASFLALLPWAAHRLWRRDVAYAITNKRAVIVTHKAGRKDSVESFAPDKINRNVAREYGDGWGNLRFSREIKVIWDEFDRSGLKIPVPMGVGVRWKGFRDAPNVREGAVALAEIVDISPDVRRSAFYRIIGARRRR